MLIKRNTSGKKRQPLIVVAAGLSALVILLLAGSYTYAVVQEQRDSFCISCHTQPEVTYYQRSIGAQPVDLASAHTVEKIRCIDCHSGSGLGGHIQAGFLGARNTFLFYTGQAVQPARLTVPIGDDTCLKCHEPVVLLLARNNHQHTLLARWQAQDPHAGGCASCHTGHTTDGPALHGFLNPARAQAVCDACHRVLRDAR